MTDTPALARLAREALSGATGGTLHVDGIGTGALTTSDVLLHDIGGRPGFVCHSDSALAVAATRGRAAVLVIPAVGRARCGYAVVLAGRLQRAGREMVDGTDAMMVEVRLTGVVVERDDPDSHAVGQIEIPLADYYLAGPDPIVETADSITRHANRCHSDQPRRIVSSVHGIHESDVAAAEICELDADGLTLRWVDARGAHSVRLLFPSPAPDAAALAGLVRDALTASRT